jgi:hypothetical protein
MPTIRIDEDVWKALQDRAAPFVDTPNEVLRRVFELDSVGVASSVPVKGKKENMYVGATPQREYRLPIADCLRERGGSAQADDVLKGVLKRVESELRPVDLELMENGGEPRWRLQARFERKNMVMDGLLKSDSAHGWWELTEKGLQYQG